jgi:CDP-diacylglycerol--serine O-phosphatidyltransferase
MVSRVTFFKLMPAKRSLIAAWPQLVLVVLSVASFFFLSVAAIPFAFILYILLSLVGPKPQPEATE